MGIESMSRETVASALQQLFLAVDQLLQPRPLETMAFRQLVPTASFVLRPDLDGGTGIENDLAVLNYWSDCLAVAKASEDASVSAAAEALEALAPVLQWRQNPNYRKAPPDDQFLAHYGYSEICGPGGLLQADELRLGVLLLGPLTCYPAHRHPAEEIYLPLQAAFWQRGEADIAAGEWHERSAGSLIHHPTQMPHATRTGKKALAALYLWRGDVGIDARLDRPAPGAK